MKIFFYFFLMPFALFAQKQPIDYVNPFIGTGGHGHTFPGATVPFGMVQLSPDTRTEGWDAAGGYHYSDSTILGFSHTHLNGTGVNDLCDVLFTPSLKNEFKPLVFNHKDEVAKAGYYKTALAGEGLTVELTASERIGFQKISLSKDIKILYININLNKRNELLESKIFPKDKNEIEGRMVSKSWAKERHLSFAAQFSLDILKIEKNIKYKNTVNRQSVTLSFDVSKTHELLIKVALSPVSEENAAKNMVAEIPHWDFEKTRKEAEAKWSKYLNRIQIEGGTEDQRTIFYTALYHTLIHPSVSQDVNGDYRGLNNRVYNSHKFQYHSIFSLWDTYRALHPLYTILCPEKAPDFVNGFLDDFDKAGHLPVWNFSGNETWCMIGNHSIPVIADAYLKGIKGFDAEKALKAMIKTVNRDTFGLKAYREKGYIPADTEGESVSKTLEYAYDDYCIAMMAKALNHDDIYKTYIQRSQNWKNIFNPQTGFFQAKINETFAEPFDPREVNFHFTEGNAWQYAFAVQHDVDGLIKMLGGNDKFEAKLDTFFNNESKTTGREQVDITGLIGQYAHGNEPSHHIAYLYNYVGKPEKTQRLVRQIMDDFYKNAPDGLIGNEDCGQMSAWYVMSSLGFYQVNPCGKLNYNNFSFFDSCRIQVDQWTEKGNHVLTTYAPCQDLEYHLKRKFVYQSPYNIEGYVQNPFIAKGKKLFKEKQQIELACADKNADIYYTTDGSQPNISGVKYVSPIDIAESKTIHFEARLDGEHSKTAVAQFKKINQIKTVTLKNQPSSQYPGGATDALVDGEHGIEQWQLGGWQGFEGVDLEAIIDLKEEKSFSKLVLRCMEDQNAWIFPPSEIRFFTSSDGQNFTEISAETPLLKPNTEGAHIRFLGNKVKGKGRYIKVVAKPLIPIPAWHKGAGGKGWIFADEIEIN